jgi:hypothetical protein
MKEIFIIRELREPPLTEEEIEQMRRDGTIAMPKAPEQLGPMDRQTPSIRQRPEQLGPMM